MNLEQAKKASDILQKINEYKESVHYLTFSETHNIQFGKLHEINNFILLDKELIDTIVNHSLHVLTEEIWELEQELKLL
jgi:hypothetical protein